MSRTYASSPVLLNLVQRPVEPSFTVHVLAPSPLLLDEHGSLLISVNDFILRTAKATKAHGGHHRTVDVFHSFSLLRFKIEHLADGVIGSLWLRGFSFRVPFQPPR